MTLLPVHIIAGTISVISGFVAVFALKGAKLHRQSGLIFVYAMVTLSLTGVVIATIKQQWTSVIGGALAFYLVTTALLTVRRRDREFRWMDAGALVIGLAVGAYAIKLGLEAVNTGAGKLNGVPAFMLFFFGTIALLGALGDVRMLRAGGLQGAHRIARHLWRMCFAFFIASGSFFLGQAKVIPKPIRIFPLLAIPALLPLVLLIYWMARVLLTKWYRRRAHSFEPILVGRSA